MRQYWVDCNINAWLCDFLTNRKMRVGIDGEESEAVPVNSGVPQGTVLGPYYFFAIYMIFQLPWSPLSVFVADDCLLYRQIKFREDHVSLTQDLQSLGAWPTTWVISLNNKICYIMKINVKYTHFYQLDGHILQQIPENLYLVCNNIRWLVSKLLRRLPLPLDSFRET